MSEQHILYEVAARVATITLNRPQAMNALAGSMREDILASLRRAEVDSAVGAVVITVLARPSVPAVTSPTCLSCRRATRSHR